MSQLKTVLEKRTKIVVYSCSLGEKEVFMNSAAESNVDIVILSDNLRKENIAMADGCSCISINHSTRITSTILDSLYEYGVRYISSRTIGYDHIDIEYADKIGIYVGNICYSPGGVADHAVMFILMVTRQIKVLLQRVAVQDYSFDQKIPKDIGGLTIGVMGTGCIGSAVISRLQGFGCKILAYDLYPNKSINKFAEYVSLDRLLCESDVISLHMPATKETYHIIDRNTIDKMDKRPILINTGRGSLVNTAALIESIENGRLSGAGLDVLENEMGLFYEDCQGKPLSHREFTLLNSFPNVIITPHMAFYTEQTIREIANMTIDNCIQFDKKSKKVWLNMKSFKKII